MITWEAISKAVEPMKTVNIKGKEYVQVTERVKAFRQVCPGGCISTDIISIDESMVIMKATVTDEDGKVLSTGLAFERPDSSYINKTSFVENCETSAVGRALGWLAIGVDASMASAEELVNALKGQERIKAKETAELKEEFTPPTVSRKAIIEKMCEKLQMTTASFGKYKKAAVANNIIPDKMVNDLTDEEFGYLLNFVEANASDSKTA